MSSENQLNFSLPDFVIEEGAGAASPLDLGELLREILDELRVIRAKLTLDTFGLDSDMPYGQTTRPPIPPERVRQIKVQRLKDAREEWLSLVQPQDA